MGSLRIISVRRIKWDLYYITFFEKKKKKKPKKNQTNSYQNVVLIQSSESVV